MNELFRKLADILEPRTRVRLALAMLGSVLVAALDTVAIGLVLPLVDVATGRGALSGPGKVAAQMFHTQDDQRLTTILACLVVGLFVLKNAGSLVFNWWLLGFTSFERVRTSARLLTYYLCAPYTDVSRRSGAELMRTIDASVMQVFSLTLSGLMTAFASLVSILAVTVALLLVAPLPTLALFVYFSCAAALYLRLIRPRATAAGRDMNVASIAGWKAAFAALGALKEVNLRGSQTHFVRAYSDAQMSGARVGRVASVLGSLPRYILEVLFILAVGVVLMAGTVTSDGGTVGVLAVFVAAGFRLLPSVTAFVSSASNIRIGSDSVDIVRAEVSRAREYRLPGPGSTPPPPLAFRDSLQLRDVSFRYPGAEHDVLDRVCLTMPFGSSLAIVGGSGAGKTTLVDIILGLHRPTSGQVLVDGVDIDAHRAAWQQNLGYVPQDTYILDASLIENIAFDVPATDIDEALAGQAVDRAQLRDLADALPNGIHSQVGERGNRLSGGQRQRLGIARALYRCPSLLVLDEATSALDNETEYEIGRAVRELEGSVSVIVVAHRLSTVRDVDHIVFLKNGRAASSGTFDELRRSDPDFERLVALGSLDTSSAT